MIISIYNFIGRVNMNERIKEILSWYKSENPGTIRNLYNILMHGKLAGTGGPGFSK